MKPNKIVPKKFANSTKKKPSFSRNSIDFLKKTKNIIENKSLKNIKNTTNTTKVKLKQNKTKTNSKSKSKKTENSIKNEKTIEPVKKKEKIKFNLQLSRDEISKLLNDSKLKKIQKPNNNIITLKKINLNEQQTLKNLLNKQKSLKKEMEAIKEQKDYYSEFSLNNIQPISALYKNIQSDSIKNFEQREKDLKNKLSSMSQQINTFKYNTIDKSNSNINILNNSLIKENYFDKIDKDKKFNFFTKKIKKLQIQNIMNLEKRIKESEINKEKRDKENDLIEKEKNEEKKIVEHRKEENNLINEKYKPFLNNIFPKEKINNYLYVKMAHSFENKEEQYINKMTKSKNLEETEHEKSVDFDRNNYLLKKKLEFIENNKKLQEEWQKRKESLPKYISPMYKKVLLSEENLQEKENNENEHKKQIFYIRQQYGKEKVPLPIISNIIKRKEEQNDKKKNINSNNNKSYKIFNNIMQINQNQRNNNYNINSTKNKKIVKSTSCMTIINNKNNRLNNFKFFNNFSNRELLVDDSDKMIKNNSDNKILSMKNDGSNNKKFNMELMKGKIEVMEDEYKRGKELLKIRGGYIVNKEFGDKMNNILINSIKNKLDMIENILS